MDSRDSLLPDKKQATNNESLNSSNIITFFSKPTTLKTPQKNHFSSGMVTNYQVVKPSKKIESKISMNKKGITKDHKVGNVTKPLKK